MSMRCARDPAPPPALPPEFAPRTASSPSTALPSQPSPPSADGLSLHPFATAARHTCPASSVKTPPY
ncbi:hypothetical protein U9M48_006451 [Paspalum notatum var. saurae]|uniref:Uncharacterized protein n=1 Tax=Paspalum notatum var. saurae TaxID=547442 RepID=A0AAQ3PXW1_PASNO